MSYSDKTLACVDCGNTFVFTAGEQEFHASKGFTNEPKRCLTCRQARRAARGDAPATRPVAAAPREGGASGERRERREQRPRRDEGASAPASIAAAAAPASGPKVYTAVCSACRGEALLPFEPVGNRAVLCSACYDKIYAPAARA